MTLKAGTISNMSNSLAKAMEEAFLEAWPSVMDTQKPEVNDHLRLMFIAVSQGVIKHLKENPESFKVKIYHEGSSDYKGKIDEIQTEGELY
ncbi:MAG: hypothetical protein H8D45_22000 [Bacteroidetes bacterium]|nr:hypothetical protein [Bacteroidota bacterium]MBL7103293.1 hypothetical protein [Bacteroidales bacterium]